MMVPSGAKVFVINGSILFGRAIFGAFHISVWVANRPSRERNDGFSRKSRNSALG